MPQNFEEKYPNNGMNRDDEGRYLKINDSRYILNTRAGSSEDNNVGAIENIKGTTEVSFDLPDGVNKCIGSEGDQTTHSNFFFIWNSLGNHTIYRYFPSDRTVRILVQDSILNFSEFDLINDINVVDDMLKWRDVNNPPRKINFEKADNDNPESRQVFHWYLGDKYLEGETTLQLDIESSPLRYFPPQISASNTFTLPSGETDKTKIAKDLTSQINNLVGVGIEAESCGEFVTITVTVPGYITITALKGGNKTAQIVPQNHYSSYIERTIDVIKHPPHCELKASVETDETFNRNYVENKVWQFAARYIYDDDEKTTVDPHSINAYNRFSCPQFSGNNLQNYIRIDFSVFPELYDSESLQTIKQLEIFVKEGELGAWKNIKVLEQFEFVDVSNQHFDFYNDGIYNVVDPLDFVRPSDLVPQRTKNQDVVKNRTFYANNLEGYNNVCPDSKLSVLYDDVESRVKPPTYTVKGRIDIRAAFNAAKEYGGATAIREHQPIWHDVIDGDEGSVNTPIVFGGLSSNYGPDIKLEDIAVKTGQILPLGGFVVYLAGTDYYGVSKQQLFSGKDDVAQDGNGVFIGTGGDYVGETREYIEDKDDDYPECASYFEINNVPDGWYSLRVASHQTTQADLDSGSRAYQKTSTNAFGFVNLAKSGSKIYNSEVIGRNEIIVHVSAGTISELQNITLNVMDLSHITDPLAFNSFGTQLPEHSKIITGYVVDHDIQDSITTFNESVADTRISRALVSFDKSAHSPRYANLFNPGQYVSHQNLNEAAQKYWLQSVESSSFGEVETRTDGTITDHNGYFFFASIQPKFNVPFISDGDLSIKNVRSLDVPGVSYNGVILAQQGNISDIKAGNFSIVSIRSPKDNSLNSRAWVEGCVVDQEGIGIPQSPIVSNRTPVYITDSFGVYGFYHYGILNRSTTNIYSTSLPLTETIVFPSQAGRTCSANFEDSQIYNFSFDYPIDWFANGFTPPPPNSVLPANAPTLNIKTPCFLGDSTALITLNAFKRGGDWKFGLVYYDRGMRSGAVNTEKRLNLHIPFYTEKDKDGDIKIGVPEVSWEIMHRPPEWATHWQWVRTKNASIASHLTWAVTEVVYQDVFGNLATFSSGTRVLLNISNIVLYTNIYPSADFEIDLTSPTLRIRFIKDYNGNRYLDYYDFKVLKSDGALYIEKEFSMGEIFPGTLIEIYNEISEVEDEDEIYYEFGECFDVKESNGIKYHGGLTQDQDPLLPSTNPATGSFRTGDTYYRLRGIPEGGANQISYIDDDGASDFYKSEVESIGRANAIDSDAAQLWKTNQIRHSLKYIPDSKINGFSTFYALNFQALPIEYGDINKLQLAANVLLSIHEFRWVSNYIEESIVRKQGGSDDLVASTDVFGSFRAAKGISGTINQESVVEYKGNVYSFDKNKGVVNRWGADGLTIISDYKMKDYFSDKAKEILNLETKGVVPHKILGVYDSKFNEYILSFGEISRANDTEEPSDISLPVLKLDINNSQTVEDGLSDSLYSVKGDKESGSVIIFDESSSPELKGVQIDNRLDSLGVLNIKVKRADGLIEDVVKLDKGQGIQDFSISNMKYSSKRKTDDRFVTPSRPSQVLSEGVTISFSENLKRWITFYSFKPEMFGVIDLEMISFTNGKLWIHNDNTLRNNFYGTQYTSQIETIFNSLPEKVKVFQSVGAESYHPWAVPSAKTPNGGETEIVSGRFVRREDSFFASVMRDKNDPAYTNQSSAEAIINARQLRDRTITVLFENGESEEVVLYSLSMLGTLSSRHNK